MKDFVSLRLQIHCIISISVSPVAEQAKAKINQALAHGVEKLTAALAAAKAAKTCDATKTDIVVASAAAAIQVIKNTATAALGVIAGLDQSVPAPIHANADTTATAITDSSNTAAAALKATCH
jgi:hypothetical protein